MYLNCLCLDVILLSAWVPCSILDFSPCIDIVLLFFHILVLREYWVLTESRKPLKHVLWARELSHFLLVLINILKKPSLPFSNIVGSLYF